MGEKKGCFFSWSKAFLTGTEAQQWRLWKW